MAQGSKKKCTSKQRPYIKSYQKRGIASRLTFQTYPVNRRRSGGGPTISSLNFAHDIHSMKT